ncbi:hypothetical protein [Halorubrum sp. 2020YC2]|uniref:hypothetical protein n=1 Tax=Halorubrum sp. 2020YC2 TaxID=2836432 RepID=UPI001BE9709C|nr:hypothetical protein [Halorubrum sp. 2020YC2]QWC19082.1 hypothetical protein KI388_13330 [Halorubrum sp. 2020YC2]
MIDESLPTPERTDAESNPTDDRVDRDAGDPGRESGPPDRGPRAEPERATDPPPDPGDGEGSSDCECDCETAPEDDEADESDGREHRLERLRLWRTVVTLAVVVARLIRSL